MFLIIDVSSRSALKSSFDGFKNIREACDVLDTFFSVSERARIKETYTSSKDGHTRRAVVSCHGKDYHRSLSRLMVVQESST